MNRKDLIAKERCKAHYNVHLLVKGIKPAGSDEAFTWPLAFFEPLLFFVLDEDGTPGMTGGSPCPETYGTGSPGYTRGCLCFEDPLPISGSVWWLRDEGDGICC